MEHRRHACGGLFLRRGCWFVRALLLAGVAVLALAGPAIALDEPRPFDPADPQMRRQEYRPSGRTLLPVTVGRSAIITFSAEEQIKRVVMGTDGILAAPSANEVQNSPLGNNLPLWAEKEGRTTIQVVTARVGQPDRVYQFLAVVTSPVGDADDPKTLTGLIFAYPEDERAKREAEAAANRRAAQERAEAARARREHQAAVARLQQDFSCSNGLYEARGDRAIVPDDACDDGQQIGLLFRGQRQIPAVFLIEPDGSERSVRPTTRGDWLIVPFLREKLVLRMGGSVLEVANRGFDARGRDPGTGTTSPDVVREVVQARAPR